MEFASWFAVVVSCLLPISIAIIISKLLHFLKPNPTLPPGPKPWPIIGNLNLIEELPHQSLHNLSQKYGPIMHLKFGSFHVVIASSREMAKQFLKTHDQAFATRPQITAAGKYTCYDYSNVTWAAYGPHWRQGRKIYLSQLFSPKRLESFHDVRVQERRAFISRLFAASGKPTTLKDHLFHFTLSVISRTVMGKKYFSESHKVEDEDVVTREGFQEMLEELFLLNGVLNIGDWIPWLGFLDLQGYVKRMKDLRMKLDRFYEHVLDDHRARRTQIDFVPKDFLDFLLGLAEDPSPDAEFPPDGVKGFALDQLAGGTDTAATTVEWAMSELMKQPHLIRKANEELDRVVGRERWVEESDIPNLPYLDAIIKETMRLHPVAVLLAPHMALEDCEVEGYHIKRGTLVYVNTWSIGRDPSIWEFPEEFRPERFLGKEIDVKGQNFEFLPFGSGRRMCPGYRLGLKMVSSCLANLLHGFTWRLPQNLKPQDLDMEELFGLATVRKFPLVAVAEPRLPLHLFTN